MISVYMRDLDMIVVLIGTVEPNFLYLIIILWYFIGIGYMVATKAK